MSDSISINSAPPYSPLSINYAPPSSVFINLTESPPLPANSIIVVGQHLTCTGNNTSSNLPLLHDNTVSNISPNVNFTTFNHPLNLTDYDVHNTSILPLPRDIDIFNALTWLNYHNTMRYAYSSPWVMQYVERPG